MKSFGGSCSCGQLRFDAKGTPKFEGFCQCPDCRKAGCGHVAAISMADQDVTITGEFRSYGTSGRSGAMVHRNFCPTCGTNVFNSYPSAAGSVSLNAALLDNPAIFEPQVVLFAQTALPWDHIDPRIPRSEATPAASAS